MPWTVACQAPLSMQFSRPEYWSGLPFPPPGDLPHPGIKRKSPALAGGFFSTEPAGCVCSTIRKAIRIKEHRKNFNVKYDIKT